MAAVGTDVSSPTVSATKTTTLIPTATETPTPTPRLSPTITQTPRINPTLTPGLEFIPGELVCNTFLETTWGNGPTQFGLASVNRQKYIPLNTKGPYQLQIDEGGSIHVPDHVNNRIMIYSLDETQPEIIDLPDYFIPMDIFGDPYRSWWNFSVSKGKIYLPFQDDRDTNWKLGVLTANGQIERILDLNKYIQQPPFWLSPVKADRNGGVFIFFPGSNVGYFNSNLDLQYIVEHSLDRWSFEDLVVGFDKKIYAYYHDQLEFFGDAKHVDVGKFGASEITISGLGETIYDFLELKEKYFTHLIGVDTNSNLYLKIYKGASGYVAKYSIHENKVVFSTKKVRGMTSLAPNGRLFVLDYDDKSPEANPKILECKLLP